MAIQNLQIKDVDDVKAILAITPASTLSALTRMHFEFPALRLLRLGHRNAVEPSDQETFYSQAMRIAEVVEGAVDCTVPALKTVELSVQVDTDDSLGHNPSRRKSWIEASDLDQTESLFWVSVIEERMNTSLSDLVLDLRQQVQDWDVDFWYEVRVQKQDRSVVSVKVGENGKVDLGGQKPFHVWLDRGLVRLRRV